MAAPESELPEGTDAIIEVPAGGAKQSSVQSAFSQVSEKAQDLKGQATDKARDFAQQGKDRAVGALENVTKLVEEAAGTIDEKVGEQYGDYARRAAEAVQGLATTLRSKEVDDLIAEARDAVKKSPAIAIGAAAALGFVVARLVKAGMTPKDETEADPDATPPKTGKAPRAGDKPAA
jgi:ElaB/YqjD/DUF883 family membrane-anchored ribosome-binding protein